MEDGLFIWLIVFAVAVLQGIGRKKKKGQMPGAGTGPGGAGPSRPRPGQRPEQDLPQVSPGPTPSATPPRAPEREEKSAEGMIPSEIWEEILGLAQGKPPRAEPVSVPEEDLAVLPASREESTPALSFPDPYLQEEEGRETRPAPSTRVFPVSHGADAALHKTRPSDVGSRLAARASTDHEEGVGKRGSVKEGLFGSGSPKELRKAVILQEVLGQPLSLRED